MHSLIRGYVLHMYGDGAWYALLLMLSPHTHTNSPAATMPLGSSVLVHYHIGHRSNSKPVVACSDPAHSCISSPDAGGGEEVLPYDW